MIKSWANRETEAIYNREFSQSVPPDVQTRGRVKLRMVEAAVVFSDLKVPPGNRLESLRGDREGQYSIRVNDQWRSCFVWSGNNAYNVELVDYH